MPIYYDKLNVKLNSLNQKDLNVIIEKNTYIPRLGTDYDTTALQGWIDKKKNFLDDAKIYTEQEIDNFKNIIYQRLSASSKLIADEILAGSIVDIPDSVSDAEYDDLILICLYRWITTP